LTDHSAIRPLIESDAGVQARVQSLRQALATWWTTHAPHLADLPKRRDLNAVRTEFLNTFVTALLPLDTLDRFKLAGVIATWWTDTLPDFKTLLENGFPGVIDGWVDAIADAVEDDETAGPAFDPFGHKLVRHTMTDYLERIATAKADIVRFKGEKEAFEQSNAPDDSDEEELENWNYAKDLARQIKEFKAENKELLKKKVKVILDQLAAIESELVPYEQLKAQLAEARTRYRKLTNAFVDELKNRCGGLSENEKRALVLELFAQDVQTGLDAAVSEKQQDLIDFLTNLWDKYRMSLTQVSECRGGTQAVLDRTLKEIGYA